jgi:Ankyrin repeats (many copies)
MTINKSIIKSLPLNKYGWTALHAACYFGHLDLIRYLIEVQSCDPNETNQNGWHALIFAVMGSTIYSHYKADSAEAIVSYLITVPNI